MAVVTCSSCQVRINVKDEMLGKRVKCPKCAAIILLEAGSAPSPWKKVSPPAPTPSPPAAITRTPPRPKAPQPPPALDELDEVVDEPLPRMAQRRAPVDDDDDDIEDAERDHGPLRRRRSRQDDDDDDDDDRPRRGRSRSRDDDDDDYAPAPRGSKRWDSGRLAMALDLTAVGLIIFAALGFQLVRMIAPAAILGGDPFQQQQFGRPNVGAAQTLGAFTIVFGVLYFAGIVSHFVAMCMGISSPPRICQSRARKAMIFFLVAVVVSILTVCLLPLMGLGAFAGFDPNMNNPQAQANAAAQSFAVIMIVGVVLMLTVAGFAIASYVCWMLYHASVADAFRKPKLRMHAIMLLVAGLVVPIIMQGLTFALLTIAIGPRGINTPILTVASLLNLAGYMGLAGWYIYLNRSLARLM